MQDNINLLKQTFPHAHSIFTMYHKSKHFFFVYMHSTQHLTVWYINFNNDCILHAELMHYNVAVSLAPYNDREI